MLPHSLKHPFSVEAFFDYSVVLTYAIPCEDLKSTIPECLELDTFGEQWAFIAVALVQTQQLRPATFPKFLGNDFFLIGYRIFVRYLRNDGRRLRGLYILKSETDSLRMQLLGNLFTHYHYAKVDIQQTTDISTITVESRKAGLFVSADMKENNVSLPTHSPFNDWQQARTFAGPMPFTFSYDAKKQIVSTIQGIRSNWKPQPLSVHNARVDFLETLGLSQYQLASAFVIKDIPYKWNKKGTEKWKQ